MRSHGCALARSGSELLDRRTVKQCEVQVGHRYTVYVCARMVAPSLARVLNYWILAPLHSVRYRLVIVTQCIRALAWVHFRSLRALARVLSNWILKPCHSVRHRLVVVTQCIRAFAWVRPRSGAPPRILNYWILATLHSVSYRLVIVTQSIRALAWVHISGA